MNLDKKAAFVEDMRDRLSGTPLVILTDFKGSTVAEIAQIRRACEPLGATFRVVKNSLCKRALAGTDKEGLTEHFRGNVAVLFAGEDPIAVAKMFRDEVKANKNLVPRAGYFEGDVLDPAGVEAVASLPSRDELLVSLLRTIQEGPRQVLGVLQGPARDLLYLLKNYETKLAEQEA